MSDPVDPLADETIARTFVLREKLESNPLSPVDILAHEGLLIQSESGKHRIYERGLDGWDFIDVPSPVSGENVRARITCLGNKTESYKACERTFDKQIHGQKVEKTVTFGDLNDYSANDKRFNEDYHFASNNCQDYQERVRSELLALPVHRSLRTAFTKNAIKLIASPEIRRHASAQFSESALAASGSLDKMSDSDGSHGIDLDSTALPSNHDISGPGRVSTISPGNLATGFDDIIDGTLPSLFAEPAPFGSYNDSLSSLPFANAQAQSEMKAESEARRRISQFQTHAPGILGAAENAMNCFRQGEYFAGVWNTSALVWSCGVLYNTCGAVSITVEVPPNLDGSPRVRVAVAGLVSLG